MIKVIFTVLIILLILTLQIKAYGDRNETQEHEAIGYIIEEGLDECHELESDNCISVVSTLDQICQVAYFETCFGNKWSNYVEYTEQLRAEGHEYDE